MPSENYDKIIELAKTATELERQQKQTDRFSVYLDDFDSKVDAKIHKQFHQENYELLYLMICNYANLLKKIVNLKSVLYKKEAIREWLKGDTVDDKYQELIKDSNIHTAYQNLNKYCNINNTAFMRLSSDFQNKTIKYEAIPSENIIILQNEENSQKIDALLHKIVINGAKHYCYYDEEVTGKVTEDFQTFYDEKENIYKDPNNGNTGIIPFVPVWSMQPIANNFWNATINDDLYNSTIQINVHLTHLNNLLKLSSYKQWVFYGLISDDIKTLYGHITDGLRPVALKGEKAKAEMFSLIDKMKDTMEVIHDLASQVVDQHGVSFSSQTNSAQKQSGFALKIEKEALDDMKEEQQPLYRQTEKQVAYKSVIIANIDFKTGIDINGQFKLIFAKEQPTFTTEDIAYYDWVVLNGYKKCTEIFMLLNPDISADKAEEKLKENKEYNEKMSIDTEDKEIEKAFGETQKLGEKE